MADLPDLDLPSLSDDDDTVSTASSAADIGIFSRTDAWTVSLNSDDEAHPSLPSLLADGDDNDDDRNLTLDDDIDDDEEEEPWARLSRPRAANMDVQVQVQHHTVSTAAETTAVTELRAAALTNAVPAPPSQQAPSHQAHPSSRELLGTHGQTKLQEEKVAAETPATPSTPTSWQEHQQPGHRRPSLLLSPGKSATDMALEAFLRSSEPRTTTSPPLPSLDTTTTQHNTQSPGQSHPHAAADTPVPTQALFAVHLEMPKELDSILPHGADEVQQRLQDTRSVPTSTTAAAHRSTRASTASTSSARPGHRRPEKRRVRFEGVPDLTLEDDDDDADEDEDVLMFNRQRANNRLLLQKHQPRYTISKTIVIDLTAPPSQQPPSADLNSSDSTPARGRGDGESSAVEQGGDDRVGATTRASRRAASIMAQRMNRTNRPPQSPAGATVGDKAVAPIAGAGEDQHVHEQLSAQTQRHGSGHRGGSGSGDDDDDDDDDDDESTLGVTGIPRQADNGKLHATRKTINRMFAAARFPPITAQPRAFTRSLSEENVRLTRTRPKQQATSITPTRTATTHAPFPRPYRQAPDGGRIEPPPKQAMLRNILGAHPTPKANTGRSLYRYDYRRHTIGGLRHTRRPTDQLAPRWN